jgi:high-affinity iron transporter
MFGNYLIGLREGLEAALIVVMLIAYLVKVGRRDLVRLIWVGVALAASVSLAAGAALTFGPQSLTFQAQEAIGGTLSMVAVAFVTWMIFWMTHTGKHLKGALEGRVSTALKLGRWSLVLTAALAVGREGLETTLFLWAAAKASGSSAVPLLGGALGLASASMLGFLIYRGAVHLDIAKFFRWSAVLLIFVAAGVLAYAIHDLQEAGILPGLQSIAFDVSRQVPPSSWYGTLLKGTLNFSPQATVLEVVAWLAYLIPVLTLFLRSLRHRQPIAQKRAAPADLERQPCTDSFPLLSSSEWQLQAAPPTLAPVPASPSR